jgi:hypothetical protein
MLNNAEIINYYTQMHPFLKHKIISCLIHTWVNYKRKCFKSENHKELVVDIEQCTTFYGVFNSIVFFFLDKATKY